MSTTVLIADDSNFARIQIKKLAEEAGYTVVAEAANGEEAVTHYKSIHPDVVTMDLSMPVKDGMQAIREIIDFVELTRRKQFKLQEIIEANLTKEEEF